MARVRDYQTGEDLGEATPELTKASYAVRDTGAVGAYQDDAGTWVHVPEGSWSPRDTRTVYVTQ